MVSMIGGTPLSALKAARLGEVVLEQLEGPVRLRHLNRAHLRHVRRAPVAPALIMSVTACRVLDRRPRFSTGGAASQVWFGVGAGPGSSGSIAPTLRRACARRQVPPH